MKQYDCETPYTMSLSDYVFFMKINRMNEGFFLSVFAAIHVNVILQLCSRKTFVCVILGCEYCSLWASQSISGASSMLIYYTVNCDVSKLHGNLRKFCAILTV